MRVPSTNVVSRMGGPLPRTVTIDIALRLTKET